MNTSNTSNKAPTPGDPVWARLRLGLGADTGGLAPHTIAAGPASAPMGHWVSMRAVSAAAFAGRPGSEVPRRGDAGPGCSSDTVARTRRLLALTAHPARACLAAADSARCARPSSATPDRRARASLLPRLPGPQYIRPRKPKPGVRRTMRIKPYLVAASAAALLAVTLTACGSPSPTASSPSTVPQKQKPSAPDYSAQDLAFTQWMTAHHQQAVQAAEIAKSRGASKDVRALATDIAKGQQDEINTMTSWLRKWGATVPTGGDLAQNMNGGPKTATAMMSDEQLSGLKNKSGKAFDTTYLNIMLEHIQSAISSAATEKQQGTYPGAKQLAAGIVTGQAAGATKIHKILTAES